MRFAALGRFEENPWFARFCVRLLQGSPPVLALLGRNPFPKVPPRFVRAKLESYQFTDWSAWRAEGKWWRRKPIGNYSHSMSLRRARGGTKSRRQ